MTAFVVTMFSGFVVPHEALLLRVLAALIGTLTALRVYSYSKSEKKSSFIDYIRFISFGLLSPHLLYSPTRYSSGEKPFAKKEGLRIVGSILLIPVILKVASIINHVEMVRESWILNHLVVTSTVVITLQTIAQCALGCWRILGFRAKPVVDNVFLSRTPAEFWRRWSWPMHVWLYRHVFVPAGGKRHQIKATIAVFLVSDLIHEILTFVCMGRVTGYWTIFFTIAAIGVLISPTLETVARRGIVSRITVHTVTITILFAMAVPVMMLGTYLFPFYYKGSF